MGNLVLSGNLDFLTLGDVIQLIGSNGGSGILHVISKYTQDPGKLFFDKGNIINAQAGSLNGVKAAYQLFGWTEGDFEFSQEDVTEERVINKNRMEIILDGLRMVDDGQVKKLGPISFEDQLSDVSKVNVGKEFIYPVIKGPLVDYTYVVSEDEFSEGHKIVEENRHGTWNWTILEGVVDIVKYTKKGPVKILKFGDGAFIGSIDSLSYKSSARSSTAIASGKVQLGVLDTQRLTIEYSSRSPEFRRLIKSLEERLREVTDKAVQIYLKNDNIKELLKEKKLVIRQSTSELSQFFIIEEGEAFVVQHTDMGHLLLAHLKKGDFIGKIPFLDIGHEPLDASVFASKEFKVSKPDLKAIREEYNQTSATLKNMIENVATSILVTTRVAYDFQKKMKRK